LNNLFKPDCSECPEVTKMTDLDDVDRSILRELDDDARMPVAVLAQRLGLARGTVHARLAKFDRLDILRATTTRIRPASLGRPMSAMVRAEIDQHRIGEAIAGLHDVPEVLECFAPAGDTDLLMRVVAVDPDDLYRVSEAIRLCPGVLRTSTSVFLRQVIPYRMTQMLDAAGA
jgi:DNA-binding Lrp family transcriptional regulator